MTIQRLNLLTTRQSLAATAAHFRKKGDGDPLEVLSTKIADLTDVALERIGKLGERIEGLEIRNTDLAQLMSGRSRSGGGPETKSWGAQFVEAQGLKGFADDTSRPGRFRVEMKTTLTTATDSGGALGTPDRDAVALKPKRRLQVRDLLPVLPVSSNSVEYARQTTRTISAAPVSESTTKPESALAFSLETVSTTVIAHWIPASRQAIDDAPQLAAIIDSELRYGLALKEEGQILTGDGTGQNLNGLTTNATAYAPDGGLTIENEIDDIGAALLQCALAELPATGIILHPADWTKIRLLKNAQGEYLLGAPGRDVSPSLFGVPAVVTQAMDRGSFLVGNFEAAATLYDRWAPRVEVSTEHSDFFVKNLIAILAEERIGLAIKQPTALVFGDYTAVSG